MLLALCLADLHVQHAGLGQPREHAVSCLCRELPAAALMQLCFPGLIGAESCAFFWRRWGRASLRRSTVPMCTILVSQGGGAVVLSPSARLGRVRTLQQLADKDVPASIPHPICLFGIDSNRGPSAAPPCLGRRPQRHLAALICSGLHSTAGWVLSSSSTPSAPCVAAAWHLTQPASSLLLPALHCSPCSSSQ